MHHLVIPRHLLIVSLCASLLLASCAANSAVEPTSPPAATLTPDYCSPENIIPAVKPINDLLLQFDDYATLAQRVNKTELVEIIPNMQTIRRVAQDLRPPACLLVLHQHELAYMEATLKTLLEFQKPEPGAGPIATGIVQAQYYHQQYALELARLLGVTVSPPTPQPSTPTP